MTNLMTKVQTLKTGYVQPTQRKLHPMGKHLIQIFVTQPQHETLSEDLSSRSQAFLLYPYVFLH